MNKNCIDWAKVRSIQAVDKDDKVYEFEYGGFNKLYCKELQKDFWFNNTLVPYVYVGLCLFLCLYKSSYILERYEVIDISVYE